MSLKVGIKITVVQIYRQFTSLLLIKIIDDSYYTYLLITFVKGLKFMTHNLIKLHYQFFSIRMFIL